MDDSTALAAFAALSQATRLRVVRNLVIAGPEGLSAGTIAEKAEVSPSNLSFHLKELEHAGLIEARRDSRSIIYTARYGVLGDLLAFLARGCCTADPSIRSLLDSPGCDEGAATAS